jgi:hypothetical protein
MNRAGTRIRQKHFRLDATKISRAQKILRAETETETIERALDLVLSEHRRNQLAWEPDKRFPESGVDTKEVYGLGTEIAVLFKKAGRGIDVPELHGHKIRPVSFGRRK